MSRYRQHTSSHRGILGFAICAVAGACLTSLSSSVAPLAQTATARTVAMYAVDYGRFPSRGSHYVSENATTFSGATVPTEMLSMNLVGSVAPTESIAVPDPGESAFVDSFFDISTEMRIDGTTFNVDSFFDITYRIDNTTPPGTSGGRTFETEMVAMSLRGDVPGVGFIEIRESPTIPSLGQHNGEELPDRTFNVDSFFDIWPEVSFNGGPFVPADAPIRLSLAGIAPEPTSCLMLLAAGLSAVAFVRRRKA